MKRMFWTVAMFGLVCPAFAAEPKDSPKPEAPAGVQVDFSDPAVVMKLMAEASKPGAEHDLLKPLVGEFTYTGKFWMDPSKPPMESKGTVSRKWVLGNRFIEETIKGTNFDGSDSFEGRGMLGYDKGQGKYTYGFICNTSTGMSGGSGDVSSDGKVLTFATEMFCPLRKQQMKGRDEVKIESPDKHTITSHVKENGQEMKVMELTVTRQN